MKHLLLAILGTMIFVSCSTDHLPTQEDPTALERVYSYDFPGTDIWGEEFANPGQVSDLGPAFPVGPSSQTRQLPSRKLGELLNPEGGTRYHIASIDQLVWDGPYLAGYWMEGVTSLHIIRPELGLDTVVTLAPCRFFAGTDSYPSTLGYKLWHRRTSDGSIPKVDPWVTPRVNGRRMGIYRVGDTLAVRANDNGVIVTKWWIDDDGL